MGVLAWAEIVRFVLRGWGILYRYSWGLQCFVFSFFLGALGRRTFAEAFEEIPI